MRSVLALLGADLDAPDHSTLSRRSQQLAVMLRRIPAPGPIQLIVDSTGLSIVGQGAWAVATHGGHGKRGWKKLHLVCRPVGGDRGAGPHRCACRRRHDCGRSDPVVDGDLSSVTADAAYDTIAVYEAAGARVENVFFRYTSIIGRWPSRAECSRAGGSGGPRVSRAESDEGRGQACVVRDQGVTNSWVGIVAGHGRFMQQGRAGWRTRSRAVSPPRWSGRSATPACRHTWAVLRPRVFSWTLDCERVLAGGVSR